MYLITPAQSYRVEVFSAHTATSDAENYPVSFASDTERSKYVQRVMSLSDFSCEVAYSNIYPILTLATCAYSDYLQDGHYLVHGWLAPIE